MWDRTLPLKIRKTVLLERCGLPIPYTTYVSRNDLNRLGEEIEQAAQARDFPQIVRVACTPDRLSMPTRYIESRADVHDAQAWAHQLLCLEPTVTHLMIQEATPREKAPLKISGRLTFEARRMCPLTNVLELYKGSRSTGILNAVNPNDLNFLRYEKRLGRFLHIVGGCLRSSTILDGEVRDIYRSLASFEEAFRHACNIIATARSVSEDSMTFCFEFSYCEGHLVFSDVDY